jgi:hypothetical protein
MSIWHTVEVFCTSCQDWRESGGAMTAESFNGKHPFLDGTDAFGLVCGHSVPASADSEVRLGAALEAAPDAPTS